MSTSGPSRLACIDEHIQEFLSFWMLTQEWKTPGSMHELILTMLCTHKPFSVFSNAINVYWYLVQHHQNNLRKDGKFPLDILRKIFHNTLKDIFATELSGNASASA